MLNNFDKLGKYVEKKIENLVDFDNEFPSIAQEALCKFESEQKINSKFMANWAATCNKPPRQTSHNFGQPPLIVFSSRQFHIEVLFWFPSRTSIHDHGFCGAFRVLQGVSVQTEYQHINAKYHAKSAVKIGNLQLKNITLLTPGCMCQILPLDGFIHSVAHLGNPSITLIVRSNGLQTQKDFKQYMYSKTGIAYRAFYNQNLLARQLQAIFVLRRLQDETFFKTFADYINNGDLLRKIIAANYVNKDINDEQVLKKCMDIILIGLSADLKEKVAGLYKETNREKSIWGGINTFKDKSKYLDIVLAELVGNKQTVNDYLQMFYPDTSVENLLAKWRKHIVAGMEYQ